MDSFENMLLVYNAFESADKKAVRGTSENNEWFDFYYCYYKFIKS